MPVTSSEAYDRGDKFACYRTLPSLRAYLLLSQQRVSAELFLRQPGGDWLLSTYTDRRDQIPLVALDAALPLDEVYAKVEFAPVTETPENPRPARTQSRPN